MKNNFCFIYSVNYNYSVSVFPLQKQGYTVFFNGCNLIFKKIIRKIAKKFNIYWKFLSVILWNIHYKNISPFTHIIVFDAAIEEYFCNYINYYFSNKRIILYYINKIRNDFHKENEIKKYKQSKWNIFSFDEQDCTIFQLKHNPYHITAQYYPIKQNKCIPSSNQIFFVGKAKDRKDKIDILKKRFDELSIKYNIVVIDTKKPNHSKYLVPYCDLLYEIQRYNVLLDIVQEGQTGATQREYEAIYFKKKLITDNKYILNRNYYNDNNIFVIDYDKIDIIEGINTFLLKPFIEIDKKIIDYYSMENWLNRFIK
jgi:hypothetical protein